ncbi:MAG: TM2 domain-containing protein [Methylococcales bacterium]|nr:TM2 domain-containing protein [Methylococcales bacterium]
MIGHIESYDDKRQTGAIKYEEEFYEFHIDDWTSEKPPKIGDDVDFVPEDDGRATNVGHLGAYVKDMRAVKNHYIAAVLGLFLGFVGAHRIYLGQYPIAIAQIALSFGLGFQYGFMWGFIEGCLLIGKMIEKDGKGRPLK